MLVTDTDRAEERRRLAQEQEEARQASAAARQEIFSLMQRELESEEEELRPRNWMRGVRTERGHQLGQQAAILDEATLEGETQAAAAARLLDELQEGRREVAAARSTEVT